MPDPLDLARCRADEWERLIDRFQWAAENYGEVCSNPGSAAEERWRQERRRDDAREALTTALRAACDEVEKLREALAPFAQPDLVKSHPGAMRDDSAIYGRDRATLRLGDFRRARNVLEAR